MHNYQDAFPDVIRIETSGKCNFRCIHCPTGTQPNLRGTLMEDKFHKIIEQFKDANFTPRVVVLYHGGEPLLNKDLANYIRLLKEIGVSKTVITTNASLLNENRAKEIILAGLDEMKVSFDGKSADENNYIRINGDFYKNANNLKILLKVRKELTLQNPKVTISNVIFCSEMELSELHDSGQFFFKEPPEYLTEFFKDELSEVEFQSLPAIVWPGYENSRGLKALYLPSKKPKYCGSLFETLTICANGDIVPCCYDLKGEAVLGNIFETNIFDIWKNQEYTKFREDFKTRKYHALCNKCIVVSPCYLCT